MSLEMQNLGGSLCKVEALQQKSVHEYESEKSTHSEDQTCMVREYSLAASNFLHVQLFIDFSFFSPLSSLFFFSHVFSWIAVSWFQISCLSSL